MPVRNILAHVSDEKTNCASVQAAFDLAEIHDATVTGLYVRPYPVVIPVSPIGGAMPIVDSMEEAYQKACQAARKRFLGQASKTGLAHDWHDDDGDVAECLGIHARYADLTVIGQVSPDDIDGRVPLDLPALAAMDSGRPVLAIPYAGEHTMSFRSVMVCWDASREATRALHDALDLLAPGTHIDVVCVDGRERGGREPGVDIAAHLARHGFDVDTHTPSGSDASTTETILSTAADLGSDLIVMGAYGHTRIREIALGGVTRSMLQHMTAPVLMSH